MAIDEEMRATIVRLSRAEGWSVGTIARHLGLHHGTVTRALLKGEQERQPRPKLIDPFIPFIREQLKEAPDLPASTLWQQVRSRGYGGGEDHFRHSLRALDLRPPRVRRAHMRLNFLPAEQAQVDWAEFGRVRIGRAERKLMGLLVTLSHSRQTFLSLYHDARMPSFLHGHVEALNAFGGVPRRLLYDNLKSAVIARRGKAVTFHRRCLPWRPTTPSSPLPHGREIPRRRAGWNGRSDSREPASLPGAISRSRSMSSTPPPATGVSALPPIVPCRAMTACRSATASPGKGRC